MEKAELPKLNQIEFHKIPYKSEVDLYAYYYFLKDKGDLFFHVECQDGVVVLVKLKGTDESR